MTSEPVGNGPRTPKDPDAAPRIRGNSHAAREVAAPKVAPTEAASEPAEKVIEGKVTLRKPPWYKRMARSMIADDASNIGDYLLVDVIAPAIKNLIRDSIVGTTDRALYGSARRVGTSRGEGSGSLRTRYREMSEGEPRKLMSRDAQRRHDFSEVTLVSREEAVLVVEALIDRVERFGQASVSDLYDMIGVTGSYADRSYGWTDLRTADVQQNRGGWLLALPSPQPLPR